MPGHRGWLPIAPNIHCVEILRTIQSAKNWREKIQINQWKATIFPRAENLKQPIKIKKNWISGTKKSKNRKMMNNFDCYSLLPN